MLLVETALSLLTTAFYENSDKKLRFYIDDFISSMSNLTGSKLSKSDLVLAISNAVGDRSIMESDVGGMLTLDCSKMSDNSVTAYWDSTYKVIEFLLSSSDFQRIIPK